MSNQLILICMGLVTNEYRCSIVARIIGTLPFPVLYFSGVNPKYMVLMEREDREKFKL